MWNIPLRCSLLVHSSENNGKKKNPHTKLRKNKNKLAVSICLTLSLSHLSLNIINLSLKVWHHMMRMVVITTWFALYNLKKIIHELNLRIFSSGILKIYLMTASLVDQVWNQYLSFHLFSMVTWYHTHHTNKAENGNDSSEKKTQFKHR